MSHFVGVVVGEDYEEALDPFWELDLSAEEAKEDYRAEFSLEVAKKDIKKKCEEIIKDQIKRDKKQIKDITSATVLLKSKLFKELLELRFGKTNWQMDRIKKLKAEEVEKEAREEYQKMIDEAIKDDSLLRYNIAMQEGKYEVLLSEWYGGGFDDNGNWGYWSNPNSKWDWYSVGGRWRGYFLLKPGAKGELGEPSWCNDKESAEKLKGKADIANVEDIDWDKMDEGYRKRAEKAWDEYQKELVEGKIKLGDAYFQHGVEKGDTKEKYLAREGVYAPFCVCKDGEWYERGSMGWWGMVSDEKDSKKWKQEWKKLLSELPGDTMLVAVDFHI